MSLHFIDIAIIAAYLLGTILIGFWLSKRASKNINSYFLAGNNIPWYFLGLSNASGMYDISGTMWTVAILFIYGIKSAWIPWLWPVWNQIFMMVFLAIWLRRSNVLTGAEWISFRFGKKTGGTLSHIIVVVFAIIALIAFMAYFVEGIGKFAAQFLPWDLAVEALGLANEDMYAIIIIAITTLYTMKGGFYSVVGTEVMQFFIITIASIVIGIIAMSKTTGEQITAAVPNGWKDFWFGMDLGVDWSDILPLANDKIASDGYNAFGFLIMLMIFKGIWASLAGPVPGFDMQRVLSTKTPKEAAKMFGLTPIVLTLPRYLMIGGICVLAVVFMKGEDLMRTVVGPDGVATQVIDFENVLPFALNNYVGVGFKGLLLAGLLAAFMSTYAAFLNAGSAYIVNDIYKRYINPNAENKTYINLSYIVTIVTVIIGLILGFIGGNIHTMTEWIVGSLYGGYTAANVLKWIWWRFNGYGYFFGMLAGLLGVVIVPAILSLVGLGHLSPIEQFPFLLLFALAGSFVGCLLTPPDEEEVLMDFYRKTRPWGFWGPIKAKVIAANPAFKPNKDLPRDAWNVGVGIAWQMCLVVIPLFLVLRDWVPFWIATLTFLGTSFVLKKTWWDRLED